MSLQHKSFLKIPRLNRDITVTEKIDGANAAIGILTDKEDGYLDYRCTRVSPGGISYAVYAQSRSALLEWKRPIGRPGVPQDPDGFGVWVHENAATLVTDLGPGLHFGEWFGHGVKSDYAYPKGKRMLALFNTKRWSEVRFETPDLMTVPVLYEGQYDQLAINDAMSELRTWGSVVANREKYPAEGVVVYHHAANTLFKATLENDDRPKGQKEETE